MSRSAIRFRKIDFPSKHGKKLDAKQFRKFLLYSFETNIRHDETNNSTDKISLRRDRTIQKFISKRKIFPIRREATEKNSRERNFFFEVQKKKNFSRQFHQTDMILAHATSNEQKQPSSVSGQRAKST